MDSHFLWALLSSLSQMLLRLSPQRRCRKQLGKSVYKCEWKTQSCVKTFQRAVVMLALSGAWAWMSKEEAVSRVQGEAVGTDANFVLQQSR